MQLNLDNVLVLTIVAVAIAYLGRRAVTAFTGRRRGCGACGGCPNEAAEGPQVVSVESLFETPRR